MMSDDVKLFILFLVFLVGAYVTGRPGFVRSVEGFEGNAVEKEKEKMNLYILKFILKIQQWLVVIL